MNLLDALLLVLIVVGAFLGYRYGLVQAAAAFVAMIAGTALGSRIGGSLGPLFATFTDSEAGQDLGGFLLIMLLSGLVGLTASILMKKTLGTLKIGWVNGAGGLIIGVVAVMAVCSAALATVQDVSLVPQGIIGGSATATFLADNFDVVLRGLRLVPRDFGI